MKMNWNTALTVTLVCCAVATTGLVVRREFFAPATVRATGEQKPVLIAHWQKFLETGERMGPIQAKVQLIEFADFECPFCGTLHKTLQAVRKRYPDEVSVTYIHFPIPGHRFAIPAARVAECAREQGRFEAMYDELFDNQESFGLKPWSDYGAAAAIPNMAQFDVCTAKTGSIPRIEEGKRLGSELEIQGTPTVIVNGWMTGHPPTAEELDLMVKAVLSGRSPIAASGSRS